MRDCEEPVPRDAPSFDRLGIAQLKALQPEEQALQPEEQALQPEEQALQPEEQA